VLATPIGKPSFGKPGSLTSLVFTLPALLPCHLYPAAEFDQGWQAVYREQAEALSMYTEAEKVAAARCQVVQERINQDPTARLMMCNAAFRRPSAAWYVVAALLVLVLALGLQLVPRDTWLACKAFLISLQR